MLKVYIFHSQCYCLNLYADVPLNFPLFDLSKFLYYYLYGSFNITKFSRICINDSTLLLHRSNQAKDKSDVKRIKKATAADSHQATSTFSEAPQTEVTTSTDSPQLGAHQCNYII